MLDKFASRRASTFSEKAFEAIAKNFQSATLEDLFANIGASLQPVRDIFNAPIPRTSCGHKSPKKKPARNWSPQNPRPKTGSSPLTLKGLIPGMAVHYARCCHPLPGDTIVGIVTTGKGVTIHTTDCETLESFARTPER